MVNEWITYRVTIVIPMKITADHPNTTPKKMLSRLKQIRILKKGASGSGGCAGNQGFWI
jgi:hypothetical protein